MTSARHTRQLAAILEVVSSAHDHPTAEEVYSRVRDRLPRVSLGTVYRNLQKLVAEQRVRVVAFPHRPARYDGMLEPHDHFLCEHCGALSDWRRAGHGQLHSSALRRAGYQVQTHSLTLYGACPECGGSPGKSRSTRTGSATTRRRTNQRAV